MKFLDWGDSCWPMFSKTYGWTVKIQNKTFVTSLFQRERFPLVHGVDLLKFALTFKNDINARIGYVRFTVVDALKRAFGEER